MAKKKSIKIQSRKKTLKRSDSYLKKNSNKKIKKKIEIVARNLILFTILFVAFFLLYQVTPSSKAIMSNLFWILALITGFVDLAFIIVGLVFLTLKYMKK